MENIRPRPTGRGAQSNPANRFDAQHCEIDGDFLDGDEDARAGLERIKTEYLPDRSRSVVSENQSPDVHFRYSVNPYRGCAHGCSYCYARPYHEYLGYSAGLDFETKILYKPDAATLFREFLSRKAWVSEPVALSGVTDPYQPCERQFRLTRECLETALEFRQAIFIITKNALIVRDLDILQALARLNLVHVNLSVTTLDAELARDMEPRTSPPARRLLAIRTLADGGIPVRAMLAPMIPGLNDHEIPALLAAVKEAGASAASYVLLRLPTVVGPIFVEWLDRVFPDRKERILNRIRDARGGKLNDSNFRSRMKGTGPVAARINERFKLFARMHELDRPLAPPDLARFRRPTSQPTQGTLF